MLFESSNLCTVGLQSNADLAGRNPSYSSFQL